MNYKLNRPNAGPQIRDYEALARGAPFVSSELVGDALPASVQQTRPPVVCSAPLRPSELVNYKEQGFEKALANLGL